MKRKLAVAAIMVLVSSVGINVYASEDTDKSEKEKEWEDIYNKEFRAPLTDLEKKFEKLPKSMFSGKINVYINGEYIDFLSEEITERAVGDYTGIVYWSFDSNGGYPYHYTSDVILYNLEINGESSAYNEKMRRMQEADDFKVITLKELVPHYELYDESFWDIPLKSYDEEKSKASDHYWFANYQQDGNPYVAEIDFETQKDEVDVHLNHYQRVEVLWKFPNEDIEHLREYMESGNNEYELIEMDPYYFLDKKGEFEGIYLGGEYASFDVITGDINELNYELENHNGEIINIDGYLYLIDSTTTASQNQNSYKEDIVYGDNDYIRIRELKRIDINGNPLYEDDGKGLNRHIIFTNRYIYDENGNIISGFNYEVGGYCSYDKDGNIIKDIDGSIESSIKSYDWLTNNTNINKINTSNVSTETNAVSKDKNENTDESSVEEEKTNVSIFDSIIEWFKNLF